MDAATQLTEPHDMWIKRAPAKVRDRVPQVKMLDGVRCWVIDGDKSIGTGAHPNSSVLKQGGKVRDLDKFLELQFEDVHLGSSNVKARLEVMDEAGIYAQIVYPHIPGFGGQAFIESVLPKISRIQAMAKASGRETPLDIQEDGGINGETARLVEKAGSTCAVAGSFVFGSKDYAKAITAVRGTQQRL